MLSVKQYEADLAKIKQGLATKVRILVPQDACPVCRMVEGVYEFSDEIPTLPPEGCSCPQGCHASYAPVLDLFGP